MKGRHNGRRWILFQPVTRTMRKINSVFFFLQIKGEWDLCLCAPIFFSFRGIWLCFERAEEKKKKISDLILNVIVEEANYWKECQRKSQQNFFLLPPQLPSIQLGVQWGSRQGDVTLPQVGFFILFWVLLRARMMLKLGRLERFRPL